jgi:AraC-like DNA-binding protein
LLEGNETRVDVVARRLGVTPRHLRRAFVENIGVGPKEFARSVRLQRALSLATRSSDWAQIALKRATTIKRTSSPTFATSSGSRRASTSTGIGDWRKRTYRTSVSMKLPTNVRRNWLLYACLVIVVVSLLVFNCLPCQVLHEGRVRYVVSAALGCASCAALVIGIVRRVAIRRLAEIFASSAALTAVVLVSISSLNWMLDRSAPRSCSAVVTWRGWVGGSKGPSRFALKVSRTPFVETETLVDVDWQHHFTLDVGVPVVVTTYPGALGDEWCVEDCVGTP